MIKTVFKCAEAGFWAETLPLGWSDITPLPHYESLDPLAPIFGLNHPDSVNHLVRRVDLALARSSELREDIGMTQRILEQRRHGSS